MASSLAQMFVRSILGTMPQAPTTTIVPWLRVNVMVGACGIVPKIDLTNIWAKELAIQGTYYYAPEASGRHTIDLATELLAGDGARSVDALITHTFPLEKYQEAIVANVDRGKSKAMKTIFKPAARG